METAWAVVVAAGEELLETALGILKSLRAKQSRSLPPTENRDCFASLAMTKRKFADALSIQKLLQRIQRRIGLFRHGNMPGAIQHYHAAIFQRTRHFFRHLRRGHHVLFAE